MKKCFAGLLALTLALCLTVGAMAETTLSFSWWGGDSRHEATQKAVGKFMEENPDIVVSNEYSAWSGWEDKMGQRFASDSAPDVNQINWNWITAFSSDGSKFVDLTTLSDIIDLSQFDEAGLAACTVGGKLQGLPVSMTGRIFYWNESAYAAAGLSVPTTYAELLAAGPVFKDKLGEDYYPLVLTPYDSMILMVYYLESVYGKNWVEDGALNYTKDEIVAGLNFIKGLEEAHVIPSQQKLAGDGADSVDKNTNWMDGHYAGIFEWDSSASKFGSALNEDQSLVVGDYFADFGEYQGGYAKVSMCFAISETCQNKETAAKLLNFLLNEPDGTAIMASERGIPLSKAAKATCEADGLLNPVVVEANGKVLNWVKFQLDPLFESSVLKATETGVYWTVISSLSYGVMDASEAADELINGINAVLGA